MSPPRCTRHAAAAIRGDDSADKIIQSPAPKRIRKTAPKSTLDNTAVTASKKTKNAASITSKSKLIVTNTNAANVVTNDIIIENNNASEIIPTINEGKNDNTDPTVAIPINDGNVINKNSTTQASPIDNNSDTQSSPSSRTGIFTKFTRSIGSMIGVSPPAHSAIGTNTSGITELNHNNLEASASNYAAALSSTPSDTMEIDGIEESSRNNHDIAPSIGGKTSGMSAADYEENDESVNFNEHDDDSKDGNYVPDELDCSEVSDYDNIPGVDDDDEFFTSFQKNTSPNINRIEGGPTKPDIRNMTEEEATRTLKEYKIARKKYTDWLSSAEGSDTNKRAKGDKITPYRAKWVADLLQSIVMDTPGK